MASILGERRDACAMCSLRERNDGGNKKGVKQSKREDHEISAKDPMVHSQL